MRRFDVPAGWANRMSQPDVHRCHKECFKKRVLKKALGYRLAMGEMFSSNSAIRLKISEEIGSFFTSRAIEHFCIA